MTNNSKTKLNESGNGGQQYINWAFDLDCMQTVLHFDLENKQMGMVETEIANAQRILNYAMVAFKLTTEMQLFEFIKSQCGLVCGIDFMQLQQNLVWVYGLIKYGVNRVKPTYSQYQRDRFFSDTLQSLEHIINKQYLPDLKPDDLTNHAEDISKYEMHKNMSKAAKIKREMEKVVEEEAYQRIKSKFANEGMQMFVDPNCPNHKPKYADKIAVIMDFGTLVYPDGKTRNLGKRLAMQFYIRLMEENGITLKQNAKKKHS